MSFELFFIGHEGSSYLTKALTVGVVVIAGRKHILPVSRYVCAYMPVFIALLPCG